MLVVESVRHRNEFLIPTIIACVVAVNQQDGAAARIERKQHAIRSAKMLNPKFLHVRRAAKVKWRTVTAQLVTLNKKGA